MFIHDITVYARLTSLQSIDGSGEHQLTLCVYVRVREGSGRK